MHNVYSSIARDRWHTVPELWVVLKEGLLPLQGLSQAQVLLDVLLAAALDNHVALLQVAHQVLNHIHNFVLSPFIH